jgi:hypothetical protein
MYTLAAVRLSVIKGLPGGRPFLMQGGARVSQNPNDCGADSLTQI